MPSRLTCYYECSSNKEEQAELFIQRVYKLTGIKERYKTIVDQNKNYAKFILIKETLTKTKTT